MFRKCFIHWLCVKNWYIELIQAEELDLLTSFYLVGCFFFETLNAFYNGLDLTLSQKENSLRESSFTKEGPCTKSAEGMSTLQGAYPFSWHMGSHPDILFKRNV